MVPYEDSYFRASFLRAETGLQGQDIYPSIPLSATILHEQEEAGKIDCTELILVFKSLQSMILIYPG